MLFQNYISIEMRSMRGCKKPRLEAGSDEEDEASLEPPPRTEREKLKVLVQRLPCYQGEGSLPIKTKNSVEEDKRQLEEERKQLKEDMEKLNIVKKEMEIEKGKVREERLKVEEEMKWALIMKNKVEEEKAKVEQDKAKVEEDKAKVEEDKAKVKQEKIKVDLEKNKVEEEKVEVESVKNKVEEDKTKVEQERVKVEEERVKMEKMSKELQSQVECPVCLTMPREDMPVPCCPLGHIVCSTCKDNSIRYDKFISIKFLAGKMFCCLTFSGYEILVLLSKFLKSLPQAGKVRLSNMQGSHGSRPEPARTHRDQECAA